MQLLQKIQTLTDAPEGKNHAETFEFEDQHFVAFIILYQSTKINYEHALSRSVKTSCQKGD